jgi:hypothetical protein
MRQLSSMWLVLVLAASAAPQAPDAAAVIKKLGGSISLETAGNEKVLRADFTNGNLADAELKALAGLAQPCILDL